MVIPVNAALSGHVQGVHSKRTRADCCKSREKQANRICVSTITSVIPVFLKLRDWKHKEQFIRRYWGSNPGV